MVIMSNVIENFSSSQAEFGTREAVRLTINTLGLAAVCYLAIDGTGYNLCCSPSGNYWSGPSPSDIALGKWRGSAPVGVPAVRVRSCVRRCAVPVGATAAVSSSRVGESEVARFSKFFPARLPGSMNWRDLAPAVPLLDQSLEGRRGVSFWRRLDHVKDSCDGGGPIPVGIHEIQVPGRRLDLGDFMQRRGGSRDARLSPRGVDSRG